MNLEIPNTQKTGKRKNMKEIQIRYIIIISLETSYKEKQLNQLEQKDPIHTEITTINEFLSATLKLQYSETAFL